MTDLAHRYHVGITSVLRRCIVFALLAVCLPVGAGAKIAETSSVEAALHLIETFDAVCGEQVEGSHVADKSHLTALTADQIAGLSAVLGYRKTPDAIWSEEDAGWYQVQASMDAPETCLFVSFEIALRDMQSAWNARFTDDAQWQSFSEAAIQQSETGQSSNSFLSGAYIFRPYEGQVIMAGVAGMQFKETGVVMLRYHKTQSSPETCELDPEECR